LVFIGGKTGSSDQTNNAAYVARLERQIEVAGIGERVHWTGYVADEEVSAYMAAADLLVMPYRDGGSLRRGTLMAALAHGRPLITTQPGSPQPALVHGQNVWLVPVDDPAALGDAILLLRADPPLRGRLAAGARQLSLTFSWDKIAAQTADFYETVIGAG
jgi:glycosyltransferase involved in cell wall biosynthesis